MINIIKDKKGNQIKEPEEKYVIQMIDGSMVEVTNFREATAIIVGNDYLDCETAETEWLMRLDVAKGIGLNITANEEDAKIIVYDERIGKIPYSFTDPNPDYNIPENPELIRVECDETFLFSLVKIRFIKIWEKTKNDYEDYFKNRDIEIVINEHLNEFSEKKQSIPLFEKL